MLEGDEGVRKSFTFIANKNKRILDTEEGENDGEEEAEAKKEAIEEEKAEVELNDIVIVGQTQTWV